MGNKQKGLGMKLLNFLLFSLGSSRRDRAPAEELDQTVQHSAVDDLDPFEMERIERERLDERVKNVVKRLERMQEWGEGCAQNLSPPVKGNVLRKLFSLNRIATKFYNKHNDELAEDLDNDAVWEDQRQRKPVELEDACECLKFVGNAYVNFIPRGFPDVPTKHIERPIGFLEKISEKLAMRLDKTYGCGADNYGTVVAQRRQGEVA